MLLFTCLVDQAPPYLSCRLVVGHYFVDGNWKSACYATMNHGVGKWFNVVVSCLLVVAPPYRSCRLMVLEFCEWVGMDIGTMQTDLWWHFVVVMEIKLCLWIVDMFPSASWSKWSNLRWQQSLMTMFTILGWTEAQMIWMCPSRWSLSQLSLISPIDNGIHSKSLSCYLKMIIIMVTKIIIIKAVFADPDYVAKHNLCSINSINWAR